MKVNKNNIYSTFSVPNCSMPEALVKKAAKQPSSKSLSATQRTCRPALRYACLEELLLSPTALRT